MILNFVLLMVAIQTLAVTAIAIYVFKFYRSFDAISEFIFGFLSNVKVHDMGDMLDDPFPEFDDYTGFAGDEVNDEDDFGKAKLRVVKDDKETKQ